MIDVEHVSKAYGPIQALDDVSLRVAEGEIVGLLGPNGAGKTTLIKILTGYLEPDAGQVTVDGLDVIRQRREAQAHIGYLPENAPLYPELSIQSYLMMMADLREVPASERRARISEAVRATGLTDRLAQPIGTLSKGYRQRVGLAQAILSKPRLLILDEPSVGLDPTQIVEMRNLIRRLAEHCTVLFSTHILPEVEALCDRALILIEGKVRADASLAELAASTGAVVVLAEPTPNAKKALGALPNVSVVEPFPAPEGKEAFKLVGVNGTDPCGAVYDLARKEGWPLRELRPDRETLESVFNRLAA